MNLQPLKHKAAKGKQSRHNYPEIQRQLPFLKEPHLVDKSLPVSVYNIINRIQLKEKLPFCIYDPQLPHNRRRPHTHLQNNVDNLGQILEKHHNSAGKVA